jgi:cob(I)alamin adenosyltransferase
MRIYTRTGDDGTTGLVGGSRVQKDDPRVEAYGTVDELNSWIGLIRSQPEASGLETALIGIQNKLFAIGTRLASDTGKIDNADKLACCREDILFLENEMDHMLDSLPVQTNFILPGGNNIISYCHLARTVCRRAERRVYSLSKMVQVHADILVYLNRLSDYLFVLSRKFADSELITEKFWK